MTTRDAGRTWEATAELPTMDGWNHNLGMWFSDTTEGWINCDGGILYTHDGGRSFTYAYVTSNLSDLFFVGPSVGWAVGDSGKILRYNSSGQGISCPGKPLTCRSFIRFRKGGASSEIALDYSIGHRDALCVDAVELAGRIARYSVRSSIGPGIGSVTLAIPHCSSRIVLVKASAGSLSCSMLHCFLR
jgi:hypothetical protein